MAGKTTHMERREALRYVGTAGLAALAGCLQEGGSGTAGGDGGDGGPTATPTAEPGIASRSFTVTGTGPGKPTREASVEWGETLSVTGTTTGSTGCHTAVLKSVSYDHPKLVVTVRARKPDDADMCTQVVTTIDYEAVFSFAGPGPETVVVKHDSMGEVRTVTTANQSG